MARLSDERLLALYVEQWPVVEANLAGQKDKFIQNARQLAEAPSFAAAVAWAKTDDPEQIRRIRGFRQKAGVESYYRKKPVVIAAKQWHRPGDHSAVGVLEPSPPICRICNLPYNDHGWIETLEGGHIVCPGDYILEGVRGEMYPCKADIFEETYEAVDPERSP